MQNVIEKVSNKKRLIDANALKERAIRMVTVNSLGNKRHCYFKAVGTDEIDKAPTVDAVEVVRCRECKHHCWVQEPCHGKSVHYCKLPHMRGIEIFKEFFCSYGERKEGAD